MSRIKGRDTKPEIALRKELWRRGLRYRLNVKSLPGKPDIVFVRAKIAIFVDGDFWHGKKLSPERLKKMSPYWQKKIIGNMERDLRVNKQLDMMGYSVFRFSEKDIFKDRSTIIELITESLR